MLAFKYRFHRRNSVQYVHKKGTPVRGGVLSIKSVKNNRPESRFAVIVSKKVHKSAVTRNRMRRRVFEFVRKNYSNITPGYDVVISLFDASVASMPSDQLEERVSATLRKAQLFKG